MVRISGPEAMTVLERVYRPMKEEGGVRAAEFRAREMHYGRIVFPEGNAAETVIDEVMAVVFRAPHSYTGEDSAEIYCRVPIHCLRDTAGADSRRGRDGLRR